MQCSRCRHEVPPTAQFCPSCGTTTAAAPMPPSDPHGPAPIEAPEGYAAVEIGDRGRRAVAPFVMTALVLAALVAGGIAVISTRGSDDPPTGGGSAGGSAPATAEATTTAADATTSSTQTSTTVATPTTTTTTTTTVAPDPNAVALTGLGETIEADRPSVDAHLGRWVPQISAKREGIQWEGVDFGFPEILRLHRELDERYGVLLVSGAEYNFKIDDNAMAGWFITIVDQSHPSPDGALDWCRLNGIDRDNCAAKLITNDQDPGRTLVLQ